MKSFCGFVIASILLCQTAYPEDLLRIPATSYEVEDQLTGIKVTVLISDFQISPTEVTQREFREIMNYNPSVYRGQDRPAENVTWWEAIRYCNLRSLKEGLEPCYNLATGECDLSKNGYRLPTDAEWSYASGPSTDIDPEKIHQYANIGSKDTKRAELLIKAINEAGTKRVASYQPNRFGLYDTIGNVWEWCNDFFNPVNTPQPATNPAGPLRGVARIIRGGSFISTTGSWARGYRSSIDPNYKSRFTGFRVCRTAERTKASHPTGESWFEPYNRVPPGFENATGPLSSLLKSPGGEITSPAQWRERRKALHAKWMKLLGAPSVKPPEPAVRVIEIFREQNYTGKLMYLQVEPDFWEKIYVMMPATTARKPLPVVIVPYYDVDVPAGKNMGGRSFRPMSVRSFAYLAVQQGYIAVAIRWYGESYAERYDEAVAALKLKYPECTGLGKWVWDAQRLLDYLYTLPEVDRKHIGIIGHSLGAKMSLYAAAMEDRITAVVFSEGGIGLSFSNYDDYWYFGDFIRNIDPSTDHHELLALIAPRPFLLIAGDSADNDKSWYYVNEARGVYRLLGKPQNIGLFNHRSGHSPTPEAVFRSVEWLKRFLEPGGE
jgi:pimeloyl-ACP methyl ester carboxylesterase